MLLELETISLSDKNEDACHKLNQIISLMDGENQPGDFVTGPGAPLLVSKLNDVSYALECC